MSGETRDDEIRDDPRTPSAPVVVCPSCHAVVPPPKTPSPLREYHHCRECGLVFRERPHTLT